MIYGVYGAGGHGSEVMQVFKSNLASDQDPKKIELFFVETNPVLESINNIQIISEETFLKRKNFL